MQEETAKRRLVYSEHTGEYIDIQGLKVHVTVAGEGDPVLLIHGVGQSSYTWRRNIDELSKHFFVLAVDMLGHGYSDKPDLEYSIEENSEFLLALMNVLRIKQAHAIAVGSGATYLLDFISHYPDRIGRAVCIAPGGVTSNMPFVIRMMKGPFARLSKLLLSERAVRKMLKDCFFDQTTLADEDAEQVFATIDSREGKEAVLQSVMNFDDEEVLSRLRLIPNQILFCWGGDDRWRPLEDASEYIDPAENSELMTIPNCGHLLHEEKPEKFNEAAIAFLRGEPAPL